MIKSEYSQISPEVLQFLADLSVIFVWSNLITVNLEHELTAIRKEMARRQTLENFTKKSI